MTAGLEVADPVARCLCLSTEEWQERLPTLRVVRCNMAFIRKRGETCSLFFKRKGTPQIKAGAPVLDEAERIKAKVERELNRKAQHDSHDSPRACCPILQHCRHRCDRGQARPGWQRSNPSVLRPRRVPG